MPINYKRRDELVDSDEEEPAPAPKQQQQPAPPVAPPPMPTLLWAAASPSLGRAAVCSTMKDVRHRIESWVRWHLHIGFACMCDAGAFLAAAFFARAVWYRQAASRLSCYFMA